MIRALILCAVMFGVGAAGAMVVRESGIFSEPPATGTGPAPGFELTAQDGTPQTLSDLRGKVVALSFAFTRCGDICPVAIYKLVWIQDELRERFGRDVRFVTITVDPEHDTAPVLADYAANIGANTDGWRFLTGNPEQIRNVTRRYGVYAVPDDQGLVDHILLTSLIDRHGVIRTQYLGERFEAREMLNDLDAMIAEGISG